MNNRRLFAHCVVWASVAGLTLSGCGSPQGGDVAKLDGGTATGGQTSPQGSGGGGGGSTAGSGGNGGTTTASGGQVGSGGTTTNAGGSGGSGGPDGGRRDGGLDGGTGGKGGSTSGSGGSATGGSGTGGRATGGSTGTGGATATGGSRATGGNTGSGGAGGTGGTGGTGGATGSGGSTGPCTPVWEDPPSNVSAWIDASWGEQLDDNIKSRKAWLIDNVMMGKGQINLCVRWGATSAPSATVKANMASSAEKWFNDWFSKLAGYGCFPYSQITVKVTGWAVKPGNESWVSDLDSSIKVYTETDPGTDPKNEPKCPDACSFFTNWNHTFPNCPGGEAFHHDYWMWLDDNLPGSGAAAVGGDWGLRMPVSNFVASMSKSNLVIEHEMGHGFGFQDYYDWPSSSPTPAGGSLMIVGSTSSQTPTIGDQWLLRRTWKEMKSLRGW